MGAVRVVYPRRPSCAHRPALALHPRWRLFFYLAAVSAVGFALDSALLLVAALCCDLVVDGTHGPQPVGFLRPSCRRIAARRCARPHRHGLRPWRARRRASARLDNVHHTGAVLGAADGGSGTRASCLSSTFHRSFGPLTGPLGLITPVHHQRQRPLRHARDHRSAHLPAAVAIVLGAVVIVTSTTAAGWIEWNYLGYEGKASWPLYEQINYFLATLAPGRVMVEHGQKLDEFGTPRAFKYHPLLDRSADHGRDPDGGLVHGSLPLHQSGGAVQGGQQRHHRRE